MEQDSLNYIYIVPQTNVTIGFVHALVFIIGMVKLWIKSKELLLRKQCAWMELASIPMSVWIDYKYINILLYLKENCIFCFYKPQLKQISYPHTDTIIEQFVTQLPYA